MNYPKPTHQTCHELTDKPKEKKGKLSAEVQKYFIKNIRNLGTKAENDEQGTSKDLDFMESIKIWADMPEAWKERLNGVEEMLGSGEMRETVERGVTLEKYLKWNESRKGGRISFWQYADLLHLAEEKGEKEAWIYETFTFPGDGKIVVEKELDLRECTSLTHLPEGVEVGWSLTLSGCTSLTHLPEELKVRGYLDLTGCTNLTHLPEALVLRGDLSLIYCPSLTHLPEGLKVGGDLHLSRNLKDQVKKDAEALQAKGQIIGEIIYK